MKQRLIFGAMLIVVLVALIYADDLFASTPFKGAVVTAVMLALALPAVREMVVLARSAGLEPLTCWPAAAAVALVLVPFVVANIASDPAFPLIARDGRWTLAALVLAFAGTAVGVAARKKTEGAIAAIGVTMLIILYVGLLASFMIRIRVFGPPNASWLLLYYVGVVKCCDIGAYFTGRAIGRTKLIEWLSPKKTVEGLAGGVTASVMVAAGVPLIVKMCSDGNSNASALFPPIGKAVLFGIAMAFVGHGGDLLESLFKRDARTKDSAAAIPAFGGILDILDSPLLAAPVAYWLLA